MMMMMVMMMMMICIYCGAITKLVICNTVFAVVSWQIVTSWVHWKHVQLKICTWKVTRCATTIRTCRSTSGNVFCAALLSCMPMSLAASLQLSFCLALSRGFIITLRASSWQLASHTQDHRYYYNYNYYCYHITTTVIVPVVARQIGRFVSSCAS